MDTGPDYSLFLDNNGVSEMQIRGVEFRVGTELKHLLLLVSKGILATKMQIQELTSPFYYLRLIGLRDLYINPGYHLQVGYADPARDLTFAPTSDGVSLPRNPSDAWSIIFTGRNKVLVLKADDTSLFT